MCSNCGHGGPLIVQAMDGRQLKGDARTGVLLGDILLLSLEPINARQGDEWK